MVKQNYVIVARVAPKNNGVDLYMETQNDQNVKLKKNFRKMSSMSSFT